MKFLVTNFFKDPSNPNGPSKELVLLYNTKDEFN